MWLICLLNFATFPGFNVGMTVSVSSSLRLKHGLEGRLGGAGLVGGTDLPGRGEDGVRKLGAFALLSVARADVLLGGSAGGAVIGDIRLGKLSSEFS